MEVIQYCNSYTDPIEVHDLGVRVPPRQLSQDGHVLPAILQEVVPRASTMCVDISPEDSVALKDIFVSVWESL